ncbi:low specificity L-threonine aldolase [Streptococcus sp. sy018]|uniref:threonine aldolase family protein n=1 Tax=Streptococcus sp. sy018 TaxID=2600147 RepID=UPI0011B483C5|nr:beta-eliminating lyase-related protein [Streptococcus sp. sy018]TWS94924.1 low specificity L-threonine aldolase [Streptococcus sp. sy018]
MLHFENDYNEGVHPELLKSLITTNEENLAGYGADFYCQRASEKIRQATACPHAEVDFLTGGTQTNQVVIASLLASYEGVIAADTGHIAVHEAGAIEYTGHKVITLPASEGKLQAADVASYLADFYQDASHAHMVFPGMVYISHPTEYGTLYTKQELGELVEVCHRYQLPLFLDGARLGYGLVAKGNDVDLPTIAELTDVFYIGGTKLGALAGEAVVFTKNNRPKQFTTVMKHHGALVAKGRLFGVQFDHFFTDDLYWKIGQKAIDLAEQLKQILTDKGYRFYLESPTNQQFIILENSHLQELAKNVVFSSWQKYDEEHTVVRLATSWSTTQADIDELKKIL